MAPNPPTPKPSVPSIPSVSNVAPGGDIGTWIGFTGLGFGVIILYSAVKGVPLFGPSGIITNALTKGQLTHVTAGGKTTTTGGNKTKLGDSGNPLTNPVQAIEHPSQINPLGVVGSNIDDITQKLFGLKPIPTSGGSLLHDIESAPGNVVKAAGKIAGGIVDGGKSILHKLGGWL